MRRRNVKMYLSILFAALLLTGINCQDNDESNGDIFESIWTVNKLGKVDDALFSAKKRIDVPLIEGDIVVTDQLLGDIAIMEKQAESGVAMFDAIRDGTWKDNKIRYTFKTKKDKKRLEGKVNDAIKIFEDALGDCIQWKYEDPEDIKQHKNYIVFFSGNGCYSNVGMQRSGPQVISLKYPGCISQVGTVVHEMMHALGFFHEQSRLDRDDYISIYWNNIHKKMWYNFKKYRPGQADTLGEPYDKQSVMHYGGTAFSIDGRRTIVSKSDFKEELGQRVGLSKIDVKQLKKYYKCSTTTKGTGDCKDEYGFCTLLKTVCSDSFVMTNCKFTCALCPTVVAKRKCKDSHHYCNIWKTSGYCELKDYKGYMSKHCKKSCGVCS